LKQSAAPTKSSTSLWQPGIEPRGGAGAARRVLDSTAPHLHAYMPQAGHVKVREAVARA